MAVYHVMKDGSRKKDLKGHVVKKDDCQSLYIMLEEISKRQNKKEGRAC